MEHSASTGVMSMLNSIHNACSSKGAAAPPQVRPKGAPIVEVADSRIRRYYLIWEAKRKELAAARTDAERHKAQALHDIAERMFTLQVWLQYPELTGRPIAVYHDWSVGPEDFEAGTHDMFIPAEPRSTRSADVNIGAIRGATTTN